MFHGACYHNLSKKVVLNSKSPKLTMSGDNTVKPFDALYDTEITDYFI